MGKKDKCGFHLIQKKIKKNKNITKVTIPLAAPVDLLGVILEDCSCTGELPGVDVCNCECECE